MKEEFSNSLRESDTVEERSFNIHNIINQGDGIDIIKHYEDEEIIKTESKKKV